MDWTRPPRILITIPAINRGQDYMKATNNVALVPANGTFELANTLSMASRCVRSILPTGRRLTVHPLPADLCSHPNLISDSHWLLENVLCLVSNAIKYSDSGDIDLRIHITSAGGPMVDHQGHKMDLKGSQKSIKSLRSQNSEKNKDKLAALRLVDAKDKDKDKDAVRMLVVTIEDHGVGVPEELRESLFQPFRQAQRMTGE